MANTTDFGAVFDFGIYCLKHFWPFSYVKYVHKNALYVTNIFPYNIAS